MSKMPSIPSSTFTSALRAQLLQGMCHSNAKKVCATTAAASYYWPSNSFLITFNSSKFFFHYNFPSFIFIRSIID